MGLLEFIIVILVLLWLLGSFAIPVGTPAVHLLLVLALIVFVVRALQRRP